MAGRPFGSKSGRTPPGGYPAIDPAFGAFLAGFIDGEACFSIVRQARGRNFTCRMQLNVRDDDRPLLEAIHADTRLGTLTAVPARASSRPQAAWIVSAKADCLRLVEILNAYPLRGRKSLDYAIWSAAVGWWIGEDATRTIVGRDWAPMEYLKMRLHEIKQFKPDAYSLRDHSGLQKDDWDPFLSGFITAEGSFAISPAGGGRYAPRLTVRLRADDRLLLSAFSARTGTGHVHGYPARPGCLPVAVWTITGGSDLTNIVHTLDRYPPRGRKVREYEIWREACLEYAGNRRREDVHRRLGQLQKDLVEQRRYTKLVSSEVSEVMSCGTPGEIASGVRFADTSA